MTHFETLILLEFLMPLVLAVSIYICKKYVDRKFKKQETDDEQRNIEAKERAELHRDFDLVNGDMAEAAMELAYATSVAVENGKTNGEMKKARELYDNARKERDDLMKKLKQQVA